MVGGCSRLGHKGRVERWMARSAGSKGESWHGEVKAHQFVSGALCGILKPDWLAIVWWVTGSRRMAELKQQH